MRDSNKNKNGDVVKESEVKNVGENLHVRKMKYEEARRHIFMETLVVKGKKEISKKCKRCEKNKEILS